MIDHEFGELVDGVLGFELLFFFASAVLARVGHGVSFEAVGAHVDEEWPGGFAAAVDDWLHVVVDVHDVHTVDDGGFNSIGCGLDGDVVSHGGATGDGGAH